MKIGIDFGNTTSMVAHINEQGIPEIFPDFEDPSGKDTPSVVHVGQRGCLVGKSLEQLLENEPALPVARNFGARVGDGSESYQDEDGQSYRAEELASLVLRKLIQDSEKAASDTVGGAVLAHPNWFDATQRQAILSAAAMAGLAKVELVEESTAIVQHYALARSPGQTLMIYNFGGSSFEATIVETTADGPVVTASSYVQRGGREIDDKIAEVIRDNFRFAHGFDPTQDPIAEVQVRHFSEQVKLNLCSSDEDAFRSSTLLCGKAMEFYFSRQQLEDAMEELLEETFQACRKCLDDASIEWAQLDGLLLSGGSCLNPIVRSRLRDASGLDGGQIHSQQPDLAVAFGTAHLTRDLDGIQTRSLSVRPSLEAVLDRDLSVQCVVPGTNAVETQVIIKRDSPLPAHREFRCLTSRDEQSTLQFDWVLAGGNDDCCPLGKTVFEGLPGVAKGYPVDIDVTARLDGSIAVVATDPATGAKSTSVLDYDERREKAEREVQRERLLNLPINVA
jgi:molecular chaperone DnaK